MMTNSTFETLRQLRARLEAEGFRRVTAYVCADALALLEQQRRHGESTGRVLDRLLLDKAAPARPRLLTDRERNDRRIRQAIRQIEYSTRPNHRGPRTVRILLYNPDGSVYSVTSAGVVWYDEPPELGDG